VAPLVRVLDNNFCTLFAVTLVIKEVFNFSPYIYSAKKSCYLLFIARSYVFFLTSLLLALLANLSLEIYARQSSSVISALVAKKLL
jgi:hypothetical protein